MRILIILSTALLICSTAFAGDYIRIGVDSIVAGATNFEIPFYIERTCPEPTKIMGISNGFVLNSTGDASWSYAGYEPDPIANSWFTLGGLWIMQDFGGLPPDRFLIGTGMWPKGGAGMPIFEERPFFSLFLDIGPGEGEILIDSAFVFAAGAWKWSGMTCGLGGAPDRPIFVDKYGNDANHPISITVYLPQCGDANRSGFVDIDDAVYVVNYIFLFGPPPDPLSLGDCDCSGGDVPVDIDDLVYLLDYILRGGPPPCDTNGDGVPDC
jgi:hypothetical protein